MLYQGKKAEFLFAIDDNIATLGEMIDFKITDAEERAKKKINVLDIKYSIQLKYHIALIIFEYIETSAKI